jgi:3-dehydroquinate synthase
MSVSPVSLIRTVSVELGARSYPIHIGAGSMLNEGFLAHLPKSKSVLVVTDENVNAVCGAAFLGALDQAHINSQKLVLPAGEAHKGVATVEHIWTKLLEMQAGRDALLIALGGGVIGDMTGFAAACYMRGIRFVQVPTTLLSQVDSSVGGKTGVNHPLGKNMIGAFHQPVMVLADTAVLSNLPTRDFVSGLAEVIKYGPIADTAFFDWLEANMDDLLKREPVALAHAIARSCEIKADVVAKDEHEAGLREILNFGHTFGHAIETLTNYTAWTHGEAVAMGMVMAADLSARLGHVSSGDARRIRSLTARAELPVQSPRLDVDAFMDAMRHDKKARDGQIRFVMLNGMGGAQTQLADDGLVRSVIQDHMA